jgi:hypothetical protein
MKTNKAVILQLLLSLSAFPAIQTVTVSRDSIAGSLRSAVSLAAPGDTILFRIQVKDTIALGSEIAISKDLTIVGNNQETGGRILLTHYRSGCFTITGGTVTVRDIAIDNGYTYGPCGGHVHVGGAARVLVENSLLTRGRGEGSYDGYGGALGVDSGFLTVSRCSLSNNASYASYSGHGGGISNRLGHLTVTGCTIVKNRAQYGGGIYNFRGEASIVNCTIACDSSELGGGIYNDCGTVTVSGSRILLNRASSSGGGIYNSQGTMSIAQSCVSADSAASGGGMYNENGFVTFDRCSVSSNEARVYARNINNPGNDLAWYAVRASGGGILNSGGFVRVENTTVSNNISSASGTTGSSIVAIQSTSCGGGIYNEKGNFIIRNSTIDSNFASAYSYTLAWSSRKETAVGGGIYNATGAMVVVNGTIAENRFSGVTGSAGGGIFTTQGKMTLVNCTTIRNFDAGSLVIQSGQGYLLNSIVSSFDSRYNPAPVVRAVGTLISSGFIGTKIACDTQATLAGIFIGNKGTPGNFGGPTKTISLGSSLSGAFGKGVKAGLYAFIDTSCGRQDTMLKAAYHDGTAWLALESDSALPAGTAVTEITTDQRGISRNNPPCAGAYEVKAGETAAGFAGGAGERTSPKVALSRDRRVLFLTSPTDATLELFTCSGQRIFSRHIVGVSGMIAVPLPVMPQGLALCRIRIRGEATRGIFLHF